MKHRSELCRECTLKNCKQQTPRVVQPGKPQKTKLKIKEDKTLTQHNISDKKRKQILALFDSVVKPYLILHDRATAQELKELLGRTLSTTYSYLNVMVERHLLLSNRWKGKLYYTLPMTNHTSKGEPKPDDTPGHKTIKNPKNNMNTTEDHDLSVKGILTLIIQTLWDQATQFLAKPDNNQVDITFNNQKALLDGYETLPKQVKNNPNLELTSNPNTQTYKITLKLTPKK